jgi:hypothetical protein
LALLIVILNAKMLNVILIIVVMLSVAAPRSKKV